MGAMQWARAEQEAGSSIIYRDGVAAKARAKREEVAGSSLHHSRCLLFSPSPVWRLTSRQAPLQRGLGRAPPNCPPS